MRTTQVSEAAFALAASLAVALFFAAPVGAASPCPAAWDRNLKTGSEGQDVFRLQQFLNGDPDTLIAASGAGSIGMETSTFGSRTSRAVVKFQEKYAADILVPNGLTSGTGIVGVSTRAKLNALCAESPAASQSVSAQVASAAAAVSPTLTVTAGEQPPLSIAPQGALYVPFTNVTLTAGGTDVVVKSITVRRAGPSRNTAFDYLSLLDEDGAELSYAYLHSDQTAVFKDEFVVPAGESMTLTVAGGMAADLSEHVGESALLQIIAIDADVPLSGLLPISGSLQVMNASLAIGSATALLSAFDPGSSATRYIQDANVRFGGIRITADSVEALRLYSMTWRQNGTASGSDIGNVRVVVDGIEYPAEADERWYTASFPGGILIPKGNTVDAHIIGDIGTTGSNRTLKFDIDGSTDVYLKGENFGYGVYIIPAGNTDTTGNSVFLTEDGTADTESLTPFFSGPEITISGGAFTTIGKN